MQRAMSAVKGHDDSAHDFEIESFPWFFDKNREIRLALFFEMLTMANIMGHMIMKFVKLKQRCRVVKSLIRLK